METARDVAAIVLAVAGISCAGLAFYTEYRMTQAIDTMAEREGCLSAAKSVADGTGKTKWGTFPGGPVYDMRAVLMGDCLNRGFLLKEEVPN